MKKENTSTRSSTVSRTTVRALKGNEKEMLSKNSSLFHTRGTCEGNGKSRRDRRARSKHSRATNGGRGRTSDFVYWAGCRDQKRKKGPAHVLLFCFSVNKRKKKENANSLRGRVLLDSTGEKGRRKNSVSFSIVNATLTGEKEEGRGSRVSGC